MNKSTKTQHPPSSSSSSQSSKPRTSLFSLPSQSHDQHEVLSENQEHSCVEIVLNRADRTYRANDLVEGVVLVAAKDGWNHGEINISITGEIRINKPSSTRLPSPITLIKTKILAKPSGYIPPGIHAFPFSFPLVGPGGRNLYETQRGKMLDVDYVLKTTIDRGVFRRTLEDKFEYLVRSFPTRRRLNSGVVGFRIDDGGGGCAITGRWCETVCSLDRPFTGYVLVERCDGLIRSMTLRLRRVERVSRQGVADMIRNYYSANYGTPGGADVPSLKREGGTAAMADELLDEVKESSEVLSLKIADGDVSRNVPIDVFMLFPRFYCAPTVRTKAFGVEYELDLEVLLQKEKPILRTFTLELYREN